MFSKALQDHFLFYAGNLFSSYYNGIVVNGDAVDACSDKEFCEVWEVTWSFAADAYSAAIFVCSFD